MATTEVKRRRGTAAQCDAMTPAVGEIIIDTTNDRIRVGDGSLPGGWPVPNALDIQRGAFYSASSASGTDNITLVFAPVISSYTTGMEISFFAPATNTGAMTVDAGAGAVALEKASGGAIVALDAGDCISGAPYRAKYNGTKFVLVGTNSSNIPPYVSAQQTITTGGTLTLAHGLGVTPSRVSYDLVCQSSDNGFTAGQIQDALCCFNTQVERGFSARKDSTNIIIVFGNAAAVFQSVPAGGGSYAALTNANWKLVVTAEA